MSNKKISIAVSPCRECKYLLEDFDGKHCKNCPVENFKNFKPLKNK